MDARQKLNLKREYCSFRGAMEDGLKQKNFVSNWKCFIFHPVRRWKIQSDLYFLNFGFRKIKIG